MFKIHSLSHWTVAHSFEEFLECAETRPLGLKSEPAFHPLLKEIRALVPVPGDEYSKDIDVTIQPHAKPTAANELHRHPEWTAIFYPQPVTGITVVIDGVQQDIYPNVGDVIVLEPMVEHCAMRNTTDKIRLSFAMLVPTGD